MALVGVLNALNGASGSGGGVNSANSISDSWSKGHGESQSSSWSRTYGSEATAKSYEEALRADQRQRELMYETMAYNTKEAENQRNWQEEMANTIYTRSIKNMIEAGINPILAYSMGLSGASVGSGATASISTPSTYMGQTFADQASASQSSSFWDTASGSHSKSSSSGSSWNNSESGLAKGLEQMGSLIQKGLDTLSSAKLFDISIPDSIELNMNKVADTVRQGVEHAYDTVTGATKNPDGKYYGPGAVTGTSGNKKKKYESSGGGHKFDATSGNTAKKATGNTR